MSELKRIKGFFCEAMSNGWASGKEGMPSPEIKGWTKIRYDGELTEYAGLYLLDHWGTDPDSGRPSGHTLIYRNGAPVWAMWYGGEAYDEKALPCLRGALMLNYRGGIFEGGRGRFLFQQDGFTYVNSFTGDFSNFQGVEFVYRDGGPRMGGHRFRGMTLVYLE